MKYYILYNNIILHISRTNLKYVIQIFLIQTNVIIQRSSNDMI